MVAFVCTFTERSFLWLNPEFVPGILESVPFVDGIMSNIGASSTHHHLFLEGTISLMKLFTIDVLHCT